MSTLWRILRTLPCTLLGLCVAIPALSQIAGDIGATAVAGSGQTLYALSGTNLFGTLDGGQNWTALHIQPPGKPQGARIIVTANDNPSTVYVAAPPDLGGLWKSTDSGDTWTQINSGLPAGAAVDGLFAVLTSSQTLYARAGQQIFKTINGGSRWTLLGALPPGAPSTTFTINVAQPNLMYYVRQGANQNALAAVLRSDNEGETWGTFGTIPVGQAGAGPVNSISTISSDPTNPNFAYATARGIFGGNSQGVFVSSNRGASWARAEAISEPEFVWTDLGGVVFVAGHEYAQAKPGGYVRSTNRGAGFTEMTVPGLTGRPVFFFDLSQPGTMFSTGGNPYRSTDAGQTWAQLKGMVLGTLATPATGLELRATPGTRTTTNLPVQFLENAQWAAPFTAEAQGAAWLSVSATSGTTPAVIQLRFDTAGLGPGTYTGNVRLTSAGATDPLLLTVLLTVAESPVPAFEISRVAGGGTLPPEGASLLDAQLDILQSAVLDPSGRMWIIENGRIYRSNALGKLELAAGIGGTGFGGDGGAATRAQFNRPEYLTFGLNDEVFVSDAFNGRLRRIAADGTISTAVHYEFSTMGGITADKNGRIFFGRGGALWSRTPANQYSTVLNTGLLTPKQIALDQQGNILAADALRHIVYRITPAGVLSVIAGIGVPGFSGDGAQATAAALRSPEGVGVDAAGNIYIADSGNDRVRLVDASGIIHTIAGSGANGTSGDSGPALEAGLNYPSSIWFDQAGDILIATERRVRKLSLLRPAIGPNGVANAASYAAVFSPGSLVAIFGRLLANGADSAPGAPWPTTLAGATLTLNGRLMPIYYASAAQINAMIPYETEPGPALLVVSVNGVRSAEYQLTISAASPGIITFGENRAVAVNEDSSINTAENPARPGRAVVVFLIGLGTTDTPVATGGAAPLDALVRPAGPSTVMLGDKIVEPIFLGLTPGSVALAQLNLPIDENLPAGEYAVKIVINGVVSNTPLISVGPR